MKGSYLGHDIGKLGFGLMRMPEENGVVDIEQVKKMVDSFIAKGFTYFDTAYMYHGGKSEQVLKEAVVDRYPRDKFTVATKMPLWNAKETADYEKLFNEQLEKTGAGYFDFYLLHNFSGDQVEKHEQMGAFDFVKRKKEEGKIKHFGFSFHDKADVLDKILTNHPEVEFVQLQINYIDWDDEDTQSGKCHAVAMKHNVPVVVMEPVRGGSLATLPEEITSLYKSINPGASVASWGIRYCASLEGIVTVLSGMSNIEQMEDNLSYMSDFKPLSKDEYGAIEKAVEIIHSVEQIPCTACRYCVDDCPQKINIPGFLGIENEYRIYQNLNSAKRGMGFAKRDGGLPADCIACGACEGMCPQNIGIIDYLKEIADKFA